MTPSMNLSATILSFSGHPDVGAIKLALLHAFALGHEYDIGRAAKVVDQCNREGPYNATGAARRIRALQVVEPQETSMIEQDFPRFPMNNSVIPCHRGGHACAWPACPTDCDGRPGHFHQQLKCPGVGRDKDNISTLQFYFSRRVTDDEMWFLHEVMQRAVATRGSRG